MAETVLVVEQLSKTYRNRQCVVHAVRDVSFSLAKNETLGLVGESGCGKTTIARCLLRITPVSSGRISLMGEDWLGLRGRQLKGLRSRLQMVFQDPYSSLNPRMTAGKLLEEPLQIHRRGTAELRRQTALSMLERVGLSASAADRLPGAFSGGQRQRIAIARALILKPQVLVADEPVSALDGDHKGRILELLRGLQLELNLATVLISHELRLVESFCDRVAVMYRGSLVEMGPAAVLFSRPAHPYTRALLESRDAPIENYRQESPHEIETGRLEELEPGHWVAAGT